MPCGACGFSYGGPVTEPAFKPLLSAQAPDDLAMVRYPVLVSPKLDGIRCLIVDGRAVSRNMKPIPNRYVQDRMKGLRNGLDGELIVGDPAAPDVWNVTQSGVMSEEGEPHFRFHIFDNFLDTSCFSLRSEWLRNCIPGLKASWPVEHVEHTIAESAIELSMLEDLYVGMGYEGVMIRSLVGGYKFGRSTQREGILMKWKRFGDGEATIVGTVEKFHNENEQKRDELGRAKRSSAKAGKVAAGMLGALVCEIDVDGKKVEFEIGTGFDDAQRQDLWNRRDGLFGRVVKVKYQGFTPEENKPRFPVFLGFRDANDM